MHTLWAITKDEKMKKSLVLKIGLWLILTIFILPAQGQNSGYVESGDVKIYFRDYGEGIPIVLLSVCPFSLNQFQIIDHQFFNAVILKMTVNLRHENGTISRIQSKNSAGGLE
jgi:hypothetical protein